MSQLKVGDTHMLNGEVIHFNSEKISLFLVLDDILLVCKYNIRLPVGAEVQPGWGQRREAFPFASSAPLALQPSHASRFTQTRQQTQ